MTNRQIVLILVATLVAFLIAELGYHIYALGWLLLTMIILLTRIEHAGPWAKTVLTASLGLAGLFIFVSRFGIPAAPHNGDILTALRVLSHAIHLDIFVFLTGLYMVVNTFAYSGFIGDMAWKIVQKARGRLGTIMIAIMVLTSILSGIFDGATIATIMGVITLTILLSSGMKVDDIIRILLLLVVATNIGGVWFVLGEPTNILAAAKLHLSPFFFLQYASPFAVPAVLMTAFLAWRVVRNYPRIQADRPDIEILLEGINLKRTHSGSGSLLDTIRSLGKIELRHLKKMQEIIDQGGVPDFEAALMAGVPKQKVYEALSINLNSEELAMGLIEYYTYRQDENPMADILIGDLLFYVQEEYRSRLRSRYLVMFSGALLIGLLVFHAVFSRFPTWLGTVIAGVIAILSVQQNARKALLAQTWRNVVEAFFLIAIFATISEINFTGAFARLGSTMLNMGSTPAVGVEILTGSAILSSMADNIAVMDVITNLISHHEHWSFFALACIVGTALGGFVSPIASVQAVIMATVIQRVARLSFARWLLITLKWFIFLLLISVAFLLLFWVLSLPPQMEPITLPGEALSVFH